MESRKRKRGDEPFADSLLGGGGEPGRRQAERLTHRLIRYARRGGHDALADWLGGGFREGRFTVDGAAAAIEPLARTLAAARLCEFVEGAEQGTRGGCDVATLYFDEVDGRGRVGWAEEDGSVHLGRLEQALGGFVRVPPSPGRCEGSRVVRRLVLEGPPVFRSVSDSRLAADQWERVMLDGFVANQLVGFLLRRPAQRV